MNEYQIHIAPFQRETRSNALYILCAATRAQVHPLSVHITRDLIRGTDLDNSTRRQSETINTGMPGIWLALKLSKQSGSLMCPVYNTDTQLHGTFNRTL